MDLKNLNIYTILGVALIIFYSGSMLLDVGETHETFEVGYAHPLLCFVIFGGMFCIGYKAGKNNKK